jgi:hypothetical protein
MNYDRAGDSADAGKWRKPRTIIATLMNKFGS